MQPLTRNRSTRRRLSRGGARRLAMAIALGVLFTSGVALGQGEAQPDGSDATQPAEPADAQSPEPEPETKPEPEPESTRDADDEPRQADQPRQAEEPAEQTEQAEPPETAEAVREIVAQIREQLEQVLGHRNQAAPAQDATWQATLDKLATRCEVLANSTANPTARLALMHLRARALAALARHQPPAADAPSRGDRLAQLRAVAQQIQAMPPDIAPATGGYWLLLADLAELSRRGEPVARQQARAQRLLARYIERFAGSPAAAEFVADARLSLAKLLDERGDQAGAARQLGALGGLAQDSPRYEQTQPMRERIARIGTPVSFEGITTGLSRWRVADHAGTPILIHVYADAVPPSVRMIDRVKRAIEQRSLGGFTIVSLRVGEARPGTASPAWPVIPVELEPGGLLDELGVDALPTLIWLDREGRLAAIGRNLAVLDHQPRPAPPAEPDPDTGEPDDTEPGDTDPDQPDEPTPDTPDKPEPAPEDPAPDTQTHPDP